MCFADARYVRNNGILARLQADRPYDMSAPTYYGSTGSTGTYSLCCIAPCGGMHARSRALPLVFFTHRMRGFFSDQVFGLCELLSRNIIFILPVLPHDEYRNA